MWYYWGVHQDPHPRLWVPGMRHELNTFITDAEIAAATPPADAVPFEVQSIILPGNMFTVRAFGWRERWRTQLSSEPEAAVFITTDAFDSDLAAINAAAKAFPEVWTRFEKLDLSKCRSSRPSSAASLNSTVETAPPSKRVKASAKSSA